MTGGVGTGTGGRPRRARSAVVIAIAVVIGLGIEISAAQPLPASPVAAVRSHRALVLLAGQSNATGWESYAVDPTTGVDYLAPPYANGADTRSTISWLPWTGYPSATGGGVTGQVRLDTPQRVTGTKGAAVQIFGPEIGWARQLFADTGQAVSVIKAAIPNTSLAVDWNPSTPGDAFAQTIHKVLSTIAADARAGQLDTIEAVAWFQGEDDAARPARAADYRSNLSRFITALRADLPMAATTPIVLVKESLAAITALSESARGGRCEKACAVWAAGDRKVRAADDAVAATMPDVLEVDTKPLPRTGALQMHLSNTSELMVGREIERAIRRRAVRRGHT